MIDIIEKHLESYQSKYKGKYKLLNSVKVNNSEYKFRYYTRDDQFRDIHVFITITVDSNEISNHFSIDLNEQEKSYILHDALEKVLLFTEHKTILHANVFDIYLKNHLVDQLLEPQDYRNILDYLQYHDGINEESIDKFFEIFIPYVQTTLNNRSYDNLVSALMLYFDKIMYEHIWEGSTSNYIDYQYNKHISYIKKIFELISPSFVEIFSNQREDVLSLFKLLLQFPRFIIQFVCIDPIRINSRRELGVVMVDELSSSNFPNSVHCNYLISFLSLDNGLKREITYDVIDLLLQDFISFANIDLEKGIGERIVNEYGYDILIEYFLRTHNTFIFSCFPISTFPGEYRMIIKKALEVSIIFYVDRMNDKRFKLSSFEQVFNINRLLLVNYEEYRNEK